MKKTKPNKKVVDYTYIKPNTSIGGGIAIIPKPEKIGLDITQNGGSEFYFNTDKNIDIRSLDVKAIFSGTTNPDVGGFKWQEKNNYTFSISEIKKKWAEGIKKWQHKVVIKMIDSPYVPCNLELDPLCLRFYIYYTLNGEEKHIVADTSHPEELNFSGPEESIYKGDRLIYNSPTYKKRSKWAYSLQLDSIYRPFFFNSVLLFHDDSSKTYAKFYFSIANGCTLRDDTPFRDYIITGTTHPMYRIGDINLNISNLNDQGVKVVNSIYNFKIKDNFRIFSEIEDFHINNDEPDSIKDRKNLLKDAHVMGIRESGSMDVFSSDSKNDKNNSTTGITRHCGIYLPKKGEYDYLIPFHYYSGHSFTPDKIEYYDKKVEVAGKDRKNYDVFNISSAETFNTSLPLNVSFSVNDASPNGDDYKTIEVNCTDIRFPQLTIENNKITIPYTIHNEDITFINLGGDLDAFYETLEKLNVSDKNEATNIFNYLYNKHYGDTGSLIEFNGFDPTKGTITSKNTVKKGDYILATYHGGYINDEESGEEEESGENKNTECRMIPVLTVPKNKLAVE